MWVELVTHALSQFRRRRTVLLFQMQERAEMRDFSLRCGLVHLIRFYTYLKIIIRRFFFLNIDLYRLGIKKYTILLKNIFKIIWFSVTMINQSNNELFRKEECLCKLK